MGKAEAAESKADAAQQKFDDLKTVLDGEVDLLLRKTPEDMNQILRNISQSIPIITVCNFKGGVGKTTLSANLAAYFQQSRRVLLIDFDYQGSLTDKLLASAALPNLEASAVRLIRGTDSVEAVLGRKVSLHPSLSNTHLFPCFYGFHKEENKILTRWLTDEKRHEIRFNLHRYLHSREFQSAFDLVIIDAPPRLTTATINAICASTHLLIPTVLDNMSTQAALNTLRAFYEVRKAFLPTLSVLGVVPTFVAASTKLNEREADALAEFEQRMGEYWRSPPLPEVFSDTWICRRPAPRSPYGRLLQLLRDNGDQSLDALSDAIEKVFKKRTTRPKKPPAIPKSGLVESYAAELKGARDETQLGEVLSRLAADKAMTVADIKAVANAYRGTTSSYKSRADAVAAIKKRHLANQRDVVKAAQIKEMF